MDFSTKTCVCKKEKKKNTAWDVAIQTLRLFQGAFSLHPSLPCCNRLFFLLTLPALHPSLPPGFVAGPVICLDFFD